MKTIVQVSTPIGSGAISIIRMSGEDALNIALKFFTSKNLDVQKIETRKMYLGNFSFDEIKEKCFMVYFKSPYSYTGEDMVEFQCHGGEFLTTKILQACVQGGAVLAENGEFSKLAFINGKMSLDEAEGIIDMIDATSEAELKIGSKILNGELFKKIRNIQDVIKDGLSELEVAIDYPEHDEETATIKEVKIAMQSILQELKELSETNENSKIVKYGINVAIVGKPNVGKSSLLNCLIGEDRAIVTNVKGTTRDILKETIVYKGIKINFLDTAGIRESEDIVEKIGIERTLKSIEQADIILRVFDATTGFDEEDKKLIDLTKNTKNIDIINKIDVKNDEFIQNAIKISALNNQNINEIKDRILDCVKVNKIDFSALIITNERHNQIIKESIEQLKKVIEICDTQTVDIIDMEMKLLWKMLGKITGESETENIIDDIFKKFCLGK